MDAYRDASVSVQLASGMDRCFIGLFRGVSPCLVKWTYADDLFSTIFESHCDICMSFSNTLLCIIIVIIATLNTFFTLFYINDETVLV